MELYKCPGLSVAVIDNFKIAWAKGYGVTEAGTHTPVIVHTLFQAGSISKPVAATGTLSLVEHGKLSLDENVNLKLKSWRVPDNEFTKDQKVTLRRIISHSAGLTVHGFPGYEVGTPIPTLVQIFNGEPPANTAPDPRGFRSRNQIPLLRRRSHHRTATGDGRHGQAFPEVHARNRPRQSRHGRQHLRTTPSFRRAAMTATGARADGTLIPGKWHIYPEMAAAGLWTTATDLAKFGIEIALSKQGKANHVLSEATTREMLKPQIEQVGLGFFLDGHKNPEEFGHNGADEGFQALLIMFADTGKGVAIMANSDNGISVANAVTQSVAKEYGWNYTPEPNVRCRPADVGGERQGSARQSSHRYSELKKAGSSSPYALDENTLIALGYHFLFAGQTDSAIQIFQLEVQDYPKFWNAYDSLGEAFVKAGQKDLAIQNYQKSIDLNPQNQNGIDALKKIRDQK